MDSFDAEKWVANQLKGKGCQILRLNYRCLGSEIDILCLSGATLLVVEVKLRRRRPQIQVEFAQLFPLKKRKCLLRGVEHFLQNNQMSIETVRFDLALVVAKDSLCQAELVYFYDI